MTSLLLFLHIFLQIVENNKIQWTETTIKLLLEEVGTRIHLFNIQQPKIIWKSIVTAVNDKGYNFTAEQCNNKWKSLKKKYKSIKDNKNRSGAGKQFWMHFDAMDALLKHNPEVEPLSLASSTSGFRLNVDLSDSEVDEDMDNTNNSANTSSHNKFLQAKRLPKNKRNRNTTKEPYWATELRLQRERHHKENLEQKERFLSLLEKRSTDT